MTLPQYGLMAEQHWRQFLPKTVKELEAKGILQEILFEAQEKTKDEMVDLIQEFQQQGLTPEQAHLRAWEMIREKYILLLPESNE